jgi:hypothetical protein
MQGEKRAAFHIVGSLALLASLSHTAAADNGFNALSDMFTYNGFGTAAFDSTDTDKAEFTRRGQPVGARRSPYFKTDSDLGLQGTVSPTDWVSGTVQLLAVDRFNNSMSPDIEWAYVKLNPVSGLAIRFGEMALPTYMMSDSRYVGYANTWIRPPNEVYGAATFDTFHGGDIAYTYSFGRYSVEIGALAGRMHGNVSLPFIGTLDLTARDVRGYHATFDADIFKVHWSYVETTLSIGAPPPIRLPGGPFTFSDFGVTSDHDNVQLQAEFISRHTTETSNNTNGWYVLGGYRVGKFLPYGIYAVHQQPSGPTAPPTPPGWIPSVGSHTASVGVRWDVIQNVDVKLQLDHATTSPEAEEQFVNVQPGFANHANIVGIAADFVF